MDLGVERLLIPAIPELLETWTGSFGFTVMSNSDRIELAENNILSFQGTTMCQKVLNIACNNLQDQNVPSMSNSICDKAVDISSTHSEVLNGTMMSISIGRTSICDKAVNIASTCSEVLIGTTRPNSDRELAENSSPCSLGTGSCQKVISTLGRPEGLNGLFPILFLLIEHMLVDSLSTHLEGH